MPCIYAHNSFGKEVQKMLPKPLKNTIRRHPGAFRIGLQGPDFLFFYHPLLKCKTNQLGYHQHSHAFDAFLAYELPIIRKLGTDSAAYAYLLGYICHFVLDSECHTYIIPKSTEAGKNHLVMENEFDRFLLKKDGYNAISYPIWHMIPNDKATIHAIYEVYRPFDLSKHKIKRALSGMRFYKKLLTCGCSLKRFVIRLLMKITFHYKQLEGHMMTLCAKSYAKHTNAVLLKHYKKSISLANELILDFHKSVTQGKPLHKRFHTTLKSNEPLD